jgi:thiol-disulfide isomerase/thioredoxin
MPDFEGSKIYFTINKNDRRTKAYVDSTVIVNGRFSFDGEIEQTANYATFTIKNKIWPHPISFILDTEVQEYRIIRDDKQIPKFFIKVDGSNSNEIENQLRVLTTEAYNNNRKTSPNSPTLPVEVHNKLLYTQIGYLKKFPEDYFSLIALYELSLYRNEPFYLDSIMSAYYSLDKKLRNTSFGQFFLKEKERIYKSISATKIGSTVPIFSIKQLDGKLFTNKQLIGSPYILAFSATWCLPCQEFQPALQKLYNKYKTKGLKVVYFNMDDNVKTWSNLVKNKKMDWINVSERTKWKDSEISKQFNVKALPKYLIIDKKGTIIYNGKELQDAEHKLLETYIIKSID